MVNEIKKIYKYMLDFKTKQNQIVSSNNLTPKTIQIIKLYDFFY